MTIPVDVAVLIYRTDGVSTDFPLTSQAGALYFYQNSDLLAAYLTHDGLTVTAMRYNRDFVVTGDGRSGLGVLTVLADPPLAAGGTLTIWRGTDIVQPEVYLENDSFPSATHNNAQDRGRLIDQDVARQLTLAFGVPAWERAPSPVPMKQLRLEHLAMFDPVSGDLTITPFTLTELLNMIANAGGGGGGGGGTGIAGYLFLTNGAPIVATISATDHLKTIYVDGAHGSFDITFDPDADGNDGIEVKLRRMDSATNANTVTVNQGPIELSADGNFCWLQCAAGAIQTLMKA